ncbi:MULTISPECIES: DsbE family thiol:disulfide interchange protein [Vibrio]|uniref:DsbE family thiol:disulfide interchange protein n=1 Tax=Vibrio TaxID=662 RepID=UPI00215CCD1C|nr:MULTISPECIES: DsbE family thiol:disulfide interchange protein [Vibrio]MCR9307589.1 DsbE family thiol:disulfide interchange protein [Vibrio diabolicus]
MRSKNTLKLIVLILLVAIFFVTATMALSDRPNVEIQQNRMLSIPDFTAYSLISGNRITDAVLENQGYVLLNVWASWCGGCKQEHDDLLNLARQGVPIFGLNYRDKESAAKRYLSSSHNPYTEVISDPNGQLAVELGVIGTPETYLIDQNGNVLIKYRGKLTIDKWNSLFSGYFNVSL